MCLATGRLVKLGPDGVFVLDGDGPPTFVATPPPRDEEVAAILERVVRRTAKVLVGVDEEVESEADAMAALQAAEVDRRLRFPDEFATAATAPSSTASRCTPASGSTATIVTGARGSAATSCDRRSRCSGSRRARRAGSSTG